MSTADNMMPPQAAPIDRSPAGEQSFISEAGVDASGWFDDVLGAVTTYGPPIAGGLGAIF